ncbi:hypothetical protein BV22DRAFT_1035325 [Leucogyrophana mollusca]|uniref:Uncharacterized protein n=1 Tax=Leucogyrophana mollusca TaxID=85980 RepID=A0ACB8BG37_9AGAM|nr:hypothetical protein BV22DRAFT_1035325 [Leucogyrophana mollusca]
MAAFTESDIRGEFDVAIVSIQPLAGEELANSMCKLAVDAEEGERAVIEDSEELSTCVVSIIKAFHLIGHLLHEASTDPESLTDVCVKYTQLVDKWAVYLNGFQTLLLSSLESAEDDRDVIAETIQGFLAFIADPGKSVAEKQEKIKFLSEELVKAEKEAAHPSPRFRGLHLQVVKFTKEFDTVANTFGDPAKYEAIEKYDIELANLEAQLRGLQKKMASLGGTLCINNAVNAVLSALSPGWARATAFDLAGTRVNSEPLQRLQKARSAIVARITAIHEQRNRALFDLRDQALCVASKVKVNTAIREALGKIDINMENVCERIGAFSGIWAAIQKDVKQIEAEMDAADGDEKQELFRKQVVNLQKLYALLCRGLTEYMETLTKAGFTKYG